MIGEQKTVWQEGGGSGFMQARLLYRRMKPEIYLAFACRLPCPFRASKTESAMKKIFGLLAGIVLTLPLVSVASSDIDIGFSPEGSALTLVLKTIDDSQRSLRLIGYVFTSPDVVKSLIDAKKRGVDVRVIVDEKANRNNTSQAALNLLVNAGIPTRIINAYKITHDKIIVADERTTETGSFNYTRAADRSNSENVIVIRNNPEVAKTYLSHWQSRWEKGQDWTSTY